MSVGPVVLAVRIAPGHGGDGDESGDVGAGVCDELLGTVDDPLAVAQLGPRPRVARVRAGLGLGQPERTELCAAAQDRHPFALLLLGSEQVDRLRAQRRVRAQGDRDRRVDARELLDGQHVGERVGAGAAVLLGKRDPHQVQRAELGDDVVGDRLRPIILLGERRDLALGELAYRTT